MIIKYVNSINQEIDLVNGPFKLFSKANFHKYNWKVNATNLRYGTRVKSFTKDAQTYSLPLIHTGSEFSRRNDLNELFEIVDYDVRRQKPGKLIWDEYYINCFILSSDKKPDNNMLGTDCDLTIYCPNPFWIKETTKTFNYENMNEPIMAYSLNNYGKNLDYPFDYSFDFKSSLNNYILINPDYYDSDFRIVFYGPCVNPTILINGNIYSVNVTLNNGEYLTIDSLKKTIVLTSLTGNETNAFNLRDKEHYIFTKVLPGTNTISWNSDFRFDITLIEQRSEPKWT